nr:hypothetical protein [Lachnospiraceae bacterium]
LTYITRGVCIQFMRFFLVARKTRYALLISLFDGLGVIPAGFILCEFFGINGLFMSYPVSSALLFISIIVLIRLIIQRSPEKYMGGLPVRRDTESYAILKRTITEKATEISKMSMEMTEFCKENGVGSKQALFLGLACEEMAVYTGKHRRERDAIDILLRITEKDLILNFRSVGQPFDPMQTTDEDMPENILMLHKIASKISYDYIMGMNNTRIILPAE